jgi:cold shock protein
MPSGTVKWFNNAKGYGFILSSDGVSDIFAHYSAITMDGYKTLKAGQEVTYDLIEGEKGLHATNITPVGETAGTQDDTQDSPELENEHSS